MATDIKKLADELVKLTVLEVNELKNVLKDEYGIEPAAAAVAVAGPAAGAADGAGWSRISLAAVKSYRLSSGYSLTGGGGIRELHLDAAGNTCCYTYILYSGVAAACR